MHLLLFLLLFLFVLIFSALPLIYLTSWIEFKRVCYLFDITLDLLDKLHPLPRYIILAVFAALVVLALVLMYLHI